ncbi:FAD-dependent monooxygenase [Woeseia oceani]|uniref:FAD-binding domain-containing protein n=1 Tax=Woeseia oceani TaxID=1548547 RepID=A0A193LDC0_9GAMM|nr:FAD-dependent monooxygenase [Woeseia oceani]ANO50525.1 hypothetical protein BA177_04230 [Woeseia oceani]
MNREVNDNSAATLPASTEVLIVGAGPTGLLAANLLAAYGRDVVLVERNAGPVQEPRAIILDDEFSRVLATLGVEPELREHSFGPVGVHYLSPLGFAILKVAGFQTPNGFANRTTIWQPKLEEALAQNFGRRSPGRLLFRHELSSFSQSDDGVVAEVKGSSGVVHTISARYLLAADGASSLVRERLGLKFEGYSAADQPHVVVDVADDPDGSLPYTKFYCDPSRPCTCVPLPYGMRRFEFFLFPDEDPQAMLEPENLARLFRPYRDFSKVEVVRKAVYVFHSRLVDRMQVGRVFLLGDSAHLMPPFGAQGMNSGARDANNLAWKISAVLAGCGNERVLQSYDRERRDHVSRIIRYSVRMGRLSNITSRPLGLLRDGMFALLNFSPPVRRYFRSMRHMPKPDVSAGLVAGPGVGGLTGRPIPRLELVLGDGSYTNLDDAMGTGFAVVNIDANGDMGGPVINARPYDPATRSIPIGPDSSAVYSPADEFGQHWCRENSGKVLLVRPDRYVAVAANEAKFDEALQEFRVAAGQVS